MNKTKLTLAIGVLGISILTASQILTAKEKTAQQGRFFWGVQRGLAPLPARRLGEKR